MKFTNNHYIFINTTLYILITLIKYDISLNAHSNYILQFFRTAIIYYSYKMKMNEFIKHVSLDVKVSSV